MPRSAGIVRKFSILLHEGNVSGFTAKVVNGTELEAWGQAKEMSQKLSEDQRKAGWRYEVREETPPDIKHPRGGGGRRLRRRDHYRP